MQISFKQLTAPEFKLDPFPLCKTLRQQPMVSSKIPIIGKVHFATTYSAVDQVLRDRQRFVLEGRNAGVRGFGDMLNWFPKPIRVLAENMLQKDEPDHRRLRSLAELAFLRKNVDSMRGDVTRITNEVIDDFAGTNEVDLMKSFSRRLPMSVICELLGLPLEDRPKFSKWANYFSNASFPMGMFKVLPGIWKLNRYLKHRFEIERKQPCGGLISELVAAKQEGTKLSEDELLAMVFILFLAGHETTTHLITLSVLTLLQRDDLRARWMAEPENRLRFVDELLRYLTPVQMTKPRYVAKDTSVDGFGLKRGEKVMGLLVSANCDPDKFENPETINFDRQPNQHVGFGGGIHFCLGAQLARIETEIGITRLLERFPKMRLAQHVSRLRFSGKTGMRSLYDLKCVTE